MAITYSPFAWLGVGGPPSTITAARLNNIELGISQLYVPVIVVAAGAYTVLNAGIAIINKTTPAANSVVIPATGGPFMIIDGKGDAHINPITVTVSGGGLICGQSSVVINGAFAAITLIYTGTQHVMY